MIDFGRLVDETSGQRRKISELSQCLKGRYSYGRIIGTSPAMQDLYYHIHVIPIFLPPLRERREDIKLLMDHFMEVFTLKQKIEVPQIKKKDMMLFLSYDYPGNVRELKHIIERFCLLGGSTELLFSVPRQPSKPQTGFDYHGFLSDPDPLHAARAKVEKDLILQAFNLCDKNYTRAAEKLNISRAAFYKKIEKYGLKDKL